MNALLTGILCCLLPLAATSPAPNPHQGAQSPALEKQLTRLFQQRRTGDDASRTKAEATIAKLRQDRYFDCHVVYKQTKNKVLQTLLGLELNIAEIREANTILLAKGPKGEHSQGGVVDHHDMWLQFAEHEVLFADASAKKHHLIENRFLLASGRHMDTWLCDLLRRDVEQHQASQIWVMKRRTLRHAQGESGIILHEYIHLPDSAAIIIRQYHR